MTSDIYARNWTVYYVFGILASFPLSVLCHYVVLFLFLVLFCFVVVSGHHVLGCEGRSVVYHAPMYLKNDVIVTNM